MDQKYSEGFSEGWTGLDCVSENVILANAQNGSGRGKEWIWKTSQETPRVTRQGKHVGQCGGREMDRARRAS